MTTLAESERLLLRSFKLSDAKAYYKMTRDKSIQDFVPYANIKSLKESVECIKYFAGKDNSDNIYIALEEKDSGKLIGAIFATRTIGHSFDMNILIDINSRKKGYMSEALLSFIPTMPQNSELIFVVDKCNEASFHTVSKLPNIMEKPFTGLRGKHFYQFSLIV